MQFSGIAQSRASSSRHCVRASVCLCVTTTTAATANILTLPPPSLHATTVCSRCYVCSVSSVVERNQAHDSHPTEQKRSL